MNLSRVMNRSKRSSRAIILSIRLHFVIRDVKINFFVYPILTKQYNFHQCWPVFTLADNWKRCRGIIHWNKRGFMSKRINTVWPEYDGTPFNFELSSARKNSLTKAVFGGQNIGFVVLDFKARRTTAYLFKVQ